MMKNSLRFFSLMMTFVFLTPMTIAHGDLAFADEILADQPYTSIFTVSAYYSPLPCQRRYATGSYEGDIKLNGRGTNGADGTQVYPGMIAAPKSYAFGTKMHIPGIGITAVHDRGGAILASNGQAGVYDRLDVWMGYGEAGLNRALNWGKRSVEVVVYGFNNEIHEQAELSNYSDSEAIYQPCEAPNVNFDLDTSAQQKVTFEEKSGNNSKLSSDYKLGASGMGVRLLQEELGMLNFFRTDVTGYYGEVTKNAVYKFQQSQGLVGDHNSPGAGVFGRRTRDRLAEITASRSYAAMMIAKNSNRDKSAVLASN